MQDLGKVNNRYVRDLRAPEVRRFFDIVLETHLPHLVKDEPLEDVDGSLMQRYCPYIDVFSIISHAMHSGKPFIIKRLLIFCDI